MSEAGTERPDEIKEERRVFLKKLNLMTFFRLFEAFRKVHDFLSRSWPTKVIQFKFLYIFFYYFYRLMASVISMV